MITKLESEVKNTVGYAEAENKESFMVGASVGFMIAEDTYKEEIKDLKLMVNLWKSQYESVSGDIKTLVSIINKYSESD